MQPSESQLLLIAIRTEEDVRRSDDNKQEIDLMHIDTEWAFRSALPRRPVLRQSQQHADKVKTVVVVQAQKAEQCHGNSSRKPAQKSFLSRLQIKWAVETCPFKLRSVGYLSRPKKQLAGKVITVRHSNKKANHSINGGSG